MQPDKIGPNAPAACDDTVLPSPQPTGPTGTMVFVPAPITPSVPTWTLSAAVERQQLLRLNSSTNALQPGQNAILTATAGASMTGTTSALEIFDQTTGTLVGACMQGSQCVVAYAATSGVHTFAAYITPPRADQPAESAIASNSVAVGWFGVTLAPTSAAIVGPGKPVTLTATATADVGGSGYQLGLYDQTSGIRLTYCSHGTTCSTTLTKSLAGVRSIVAYVAGASETLPPPAIQAKSAPISATWLGVTLDASTTHPQRGSSVVLRATANVDVTNTPWSIGIYDEHGDLVNDACKSGTTCSARVTLPTGSTPWFSAVIGAAGPQRDYSSSAIAQLVQTVQTRSSLINIQARSAAVQPTRLLWGVDSCRALTSIATGESHTLYSQVHGHYGIPDFWGRYLTTTYNCPGISSAEIATAASRQMGILPIYDDYDCSAVHGYNTGLRYATEASAAAANLGIPLGTALAVDVEPPGPYCPGAASVDAAFIDGWYDGITSAGFVSLYYGNGTAGSEFGSAWCRAVNDRPEIAASSYLWSFEPSLLGWYTKASAPEYSPEQPGCPGNYAAWQYELSSGSSPDVDSNEATSRLPLWYPQIG